MHLSQLDPAEIPNAELISRFTRAGPLAKYGGRSSQYHTTLSGRVFRHLTPNGFYGVMESLDDGSLRQMTLGSSSIQRAITMLCPLDVPGSANPQPAELLVLRLQSKGAP